MSSIPECKSAILLKPKVFITNTVDKPDGSTEITTIAMPLEDETSAQIGTRLESAIKEAIKDKKVIKTKNNK